MRAEAHSTRVSEPQVWGLRVQGVTFPLSRRGRSCSELSRASSLMTLQEALGPLPSPEKSSAPSLPFQVPSTSAPTLQSPHP